MSCKYDRKNVGIEERFVKALVILAFVVSVLTILLTAEGCTPKVPPVKPPPFDYYDADQRQKAIDAYKKMMEDNPEIRDTQDVIDEIEEKR